MKNEEVNKILQGWVIFKYSNAIWEHQIRVLEILVVLREWLILRG